MMVSRARRRRTIYLIATVLAVAAGGVILSLRAQYTFVLGQSLNIVTLSRGRMLVEHYLPYYRLTTDPSEPPIRRYNSHLDYWARVSWLESSQWSPQLVSFTVIPGDRSRIDVPIWIIPLCWLSVTIYGMYCNQRILIGFSREAAQERSLAMRFVRGLLGASIIALSCQVAITILTFVFVKPLVLIRFENSVDVLWFASILSVTACGCCCAFYYMRVLMASTWHRTHTCGACGYSLIGNTSGRCPECGTMCFV